eukprot:4306070-Pyramimonas_sp.AAC.1
MVMMMLMLMMMMMMLMSSALGSGADSAPRSGAAPPDQPESLARAESRRGPSISRRARCFAR